MEQWNLQFFQFLLNNRNNLVAYTFCSKLFSPIPCHLDEIYNPETPCTGLTGQMNIQSLHTATKEKQPVMIIAQIKNISHNRFWRRKGHILGADTIADLVFWKTIFQLFPLLVFHLRFWSRFWSCPRRPLRMRISARAAFIVRAIILAVNRASVFDERAARSRALCLIFASRETCPRGLENLFRWKFEKKLNQ